MPEPTSMNLYYALSLVISSVSLLLSLLVAYFAYFQSAKPKVLVGPNLIVFHSSVGTFKGRIWGGVTFVLPVTFYNWSPKGCSIQEVRLVLGQKITPDTYYDMTWTNFVKFVDGAEWAEEDLAQPIAISGRSSVTKFIRFDWSPLTGEKLNLKTGQYELMLFFWVDTLTKPLIQKQFTFNISETIQQGYNETLANQVSFGFWIPISDTKRTNNLMTKADIKKIYQS